MGHKVEGLDFEWRFEPGDDRLRGVDIDWWFTLAVMTERSVCCIKIFFFWDDTAVSGIALARCLERLWNADLYFLFLSLNSIEDDFNCAPGDGRLRGADTDGWWGTDVIHETDLLWNNYLWLTVRNLYMFDSVEVMGHIFDPVKTGY